MQSAKTGKGRQANGDEPSAVEPTPPGPHSGTGSSAQPPLNPDAARPGKPDGSLSGRRQRQPPAEKPAEAPEETPRQYSTGSGSPPSGLQAAQASQPNPAAGRLNGLVPFLFNLLAVISLALIFGGLLGLLLQLLAGRP